MAFLKQEYRISFFKRRIQKTSFLRSLKLKIQFLKTFNAIEGLGDEIEGMSKKHTLKRENSKEKIKSLGRLIQEV